MSNTSGVRQEEKEDVFKAHRLCVSLNARLKCNTEEGGRDLPHGAAQRGGPGVLRGRGW